MAGQGDRGRGEPTRVPGGTPPPRGPRRRRGRVPRSEHRTRGACPSRRSLRERTRPSTETQSGDPRTVPPVRPRSHHA